MLCYIYVHQICPQGYPPCSHGEYNSPASLPPPHWPLYNALKLIWCVSGKRMQQMICGMVFGAHWGCQVTNHITTNTLPHHHS